MRDKQTNTTSIKYIHGLEIAFLAVGLLLITIFVTAHVHRAALSRSAVDSFHVLKEHPVGKGVASLRTSQLTVDFSLWSSQRIAAYEQSLSAYFDPPLGILRIRKVHLEAPILSGTDDLSLNRGVGLIAGTSRPGAGGRIGIAGHRDGFFRVLKDVGRGDIIELETLERVDIYRVDDIVVVTPDDVRVLYPTPSRTLVLVTCYPFYFVGSAPQRYIVMASLDRSVTPSGSNQSRSNTTAVRSQPVLEDSRPPSQDSIQEITQ